MWYRFEAYNQEVRYGWTRDPQVVEAGLRELNGNRDVNLYAAVELSDSDDESDGRSIPLSKRDDHVFTDDSYVDEDGNLAHQ